jgi:hypothetical protein
MQNPPEMDECFSSTTCPFPQMKKRLCSTTSPVFRYNLGLINYFTPKISSLCQPPCPPETCCVTPLSDYAEIMREESLRSFEIVGLFRILDELGISFPIFTHIRINVKISLTLFSFGKRSGFCQRFDSGLRKLREMSISSYMPTNRTS